jgi:hypothetical protein
LEKTETYETTTARRDKRWQISKTQLYKKLTDLSQKNNSENIE